MSANHVPEFSTQITSSVAPVTITPTLEPGTPPPDIQELILANTSASTNTQVTVSDGFNNYYFDVPGSTTIQVQNLQSDHRSTAWTVTCATSVASLDVSAVFN